MTVKSYEVVGYVFDGGVYCLHCTDQLKVSLKDPYFAGNESDYQVSCCHCLDLIELS